MRRDVAVRYKIGASSCHPTIATGCLNFNMSFVSSPKSHKNQTIYMETYLMFIIIIGGKQIQKIP